MTVEKAIKMLEAFAQAKRKMVNEMLDPRKSWNENPNEGPASFARTISKNYLGEAEFIEKVVELLKAKPSKKPSRKTK